MSDTATVASIATNGIETIVQFVISGICYIPFFKKCGLEWWKSFIPGYRMYCRGLCARREQEGRILAFLEVITYLLALTILVDGVPGALLLILSLVQVICLIINFVQAIKLNIGTCDIFNRRRTWVLLWMLFADIVALHWGLSKKFQPSRLATDKDEGAEESGITADEEAEGLSVNINARTARTAFQTVTLLKDIHMVIPKGHMVLLLGGSGAGKTTFLNAVTGYEKADAAITINDINVYNNYEQVKYNLGFVPQQELMRGNDTVLKTLEDAANIRLPKEMSVKDKKQHVQDMLESFGLSMLQNTMVEKLSGGQKKRLSIAIEFISDPDLFILDEPDSGLDGVVARGLFEKLRDIADQGKIVIVITHTPDRVIDLFDDVIVLAKDSTRTGRLAFYGPVSTAKRFFARGTMEAVLRTINQKEEGGEGRADEFIAMYSHIARLVGEGKTCEEAADTVIVEKYKGATA
ncbi:MAG: ABC transporter ATP-binding protein [Clostridiales bacterium]|nr:ABC transporter ATP-binding protein [Clostridiales bacterium]